MKKTFLSFVFMFSLILSTIFIFCGCDSTIKEETQYTITYHLNNGTNGNNPSSYTINTNDIILEDASKTGYTFNGWYLEAGFENEIETIDTSLLQNYNLYAKFTINQYTMTFNTNGGSEISSITQDYNSAVVRPSNPTRAGYNFGGWYTDNNTFENEYEFTTMPLNGITIYAKWNIETGSEPPPWSGEVG